MATENRCNKCGGHLFISGNTTRCDSCDYTYVQPEHPGPFDRPEIPFDKAEDDASK